MIKIKSLRNKQEKENSSIWERASTKKPINSIMVDRTLPHVLILGPCEYITLYDKRELILKLWDGKIILKKLSRVKLRTLVLKSRVFPNCSQKKNQRDETCHCKVKNYKKDAKRQGMWIASSTWRMQGHRFTPITSSKENRKLTLILT